MTTFQLIALGGTAAWIAVVAVYFRRSTVLLVAGLVAVAIYTGVALAYGAVTFDQLGLGPPESWWVTVGLAAAWTGLMYAYSPLADWLASQVFEKPPTLDAFRAIQESTIKLIAGIVVAWILGGVLEELVFRGILLKSVEALLSPSLTSPIATAAGVCIAASGAGVAHLYQGPRAALIVTQLSVLFGVRRSNKGVPPCRRSIPRRQGRGIPVTELDTSWGSRFSSPLWLLLPLRRSSPSKTDGPLGFEDASSVRQSCNCMRLVIRANLRLPFVLLDLISSFKPPRSRIG